jgi:hypothetical protein
MGLNCGIDPASTYLGEHLVPLACNNMSMELFGVGNGAEAVI